MSKTRTRLNYAWIQELGMYEATSPDIKGFRATGTTLEEASKAATAVLAMIERHRAGEEQRVVRVVEYAAA